MKLTAKHLAGGHLVEVMGHYLFTAKQRAVFLEHARDSDRRQRDTFTALYGWTPPLEVDEVSGVMPGYVKLSRQVSDAWMFGDPLAVALASYKKNSVRLADCARTLLTGLVEFGRDPSGDTCLLGTLPGPKTAEVWIHGSESFDEVYPSFACFITRYFRPVEDESDDDTTTLLTKRLGQRHFEAQAKRKPWDSALQLYRRTKWLLPLLRGQGPVQLASQLAHAPTYADWLKEKTLLTKQPVLAAYWMLAHFALGNIRECREAVALARECPGSVIAALCDQVAQGTVPQLDADVLRAVRKNASAALRAPGAESSGSIPDPLELLDRLAAGEDGWKLLALTTDVTTHDALLQRMQKRTRTIAGYFEGRAEGAHLRWPYDAKDYEQCYSPAVVAAFRSGLRYDADHPESFAGLTQTLSLVQGDSGIAAAKEAFTTLAEDDDRLPELIRWLEHSTHQQAEAALEVGALRFLATLDQAKNLSERRRERGMSLASVFEVDTHFAEALRAALRRGGQAASRLAIMVLGHDSNLTLFGTALGLAVQVATRDRSPLVAPWAMGYASMIVERRSTAEFLEAEVEFNLAECVVGLATMAPKQALPWLKNVFDAPRQHHDADLAIRGAALAGLLILEPEHPAWQQWTERFLACRTEAPSIYSVLRGIEEGRVRVPRDWLAPHAFAALGQDFAEGETPAFSIINSSTVAASRIAGRVTASLGYTDLPKVDHDDLYAHRVKPKDLPQALLQPYRYSMEHVFERIRKENLRAPAIVKSASIVLHDVLRVSADDRENSRGHTVSEGLLMLQQQGPEALPVLYAFLALPRIRPSFIPEILLCARTCGAEADVRTWLQNAPAAEVFAELAAPSPRAFAFIDVVAAHAAAHWGDAAVESCLASLAWRYRLAQRVYAHEDPVLFFLPRVITSLGFVDRVRALLPKKLDTYYTNESALVLACEFTPAPLTTDWKKPCTLVTRLGRTFAICLYRLTLRGSKLTWISRFESTSYLGNRETSGTWTFADRPTAIAFANRELNAASRLGFAPRKARGKG